MPIYRIEITHGGDTETAEVQCDSVEEMRARALRVATDQIKALTEDFWEQRRWVLRVTDESNMTILSLSFLAD